VNEEPINASRRHLWSRRTALRAALGVMGASLLAACAPAAAPAPTTAPAPAAKPTEAPKPAAPTTAPAPTAAAAAKPTEAPKPAAAPTTAPATTSAAPSGTLRYASADFGSESLDPIVVGTNWLQSITDNVLQYDGQGNVVPALAESFEVSPDGLTWTFKIRKGVKFHNGDPLTAADVAFSIERFGSKESNNPWSPYLLRNRESVVARDDDTVIYKALKPEPHLRVSFAECYVIPKAYFEKVGQDGFRANPIGTGPYKYVKWVPKTSMEMDANPEYWGPTKPSFAKVIETLVPEESTRVAQLERGEADIIGALTFDRLIELRNKGFRLQEVGLPTAANLSFPGTFMTQGPTSDIKVRQAMSYAINRQELSDTFYKGLAKPGGWWFFSDRTWGWDGSLKPDPFDQARARQLLQEAGYPGKFNPPTVTIFTQPVNADLMQIVQGYWQAVGIQADVQTVDTPVYNGLVFVRATAPTDKQVGIVWPWVSQTAPNNFYHSANMFTSTGVHTTGNDPKADEMYQAAASELDEAKGKALWASFFKYVYEVMWINIGLVNYPSNWVVGPNVGALRGNQHRTFPYSHAYWERKA